MFVRGNTAVARARVMLAACAVAACAMATGCSSGSGGSGQPSWAKALGSGVTVDSPGSASPGNGSPEGLMVGVVKALASRNYADFCKYEQPSAQSTCTSALTQATSAQVASLLPAFKNFALGFTVIDGDKALIGITGTICVPNQAVPDKTPICITNKDPAAILSSDKPFGTLWTEAVSAPANVYSLNPVVKINGNWYAAISNI